MHILWKLKSVRKKEVMAEITEQPHYNTLSTIVRNLEEKDVAHNAYGKTHQYYPIIAIEDYRKGFMNTAIDNYFNSSYKKHGFVFCQEEKISQRTSRNSGHDRKSERRKIDSPKITIVYLKYKRWKHYLFTS
jgi:predicted transcriptional regulator